MEQAGAVQAKGVRAGRCGRLRSRARDRRVKRRRAREMLRALTLAVLSIPALAVGGESRDASGAPVGRAASSEALGPGGWSWFADPRAVSYRGRYRRSYVGWVDPSGRVVVESHDGQQRVRSVLGRNRRSDDHDNPALLMLADGRLMLFYSHHDLGPMRYRTSLRPEDITAFGPERVLHTNVNGPPHKGWTYPNPVQLRSERNRIFLFWRAANWNPAFSTQRPGGRWARARTLIRVPGQRPYLKVDTNSRDAMYFAFTRGHPLNVRGSGIYFVRYRRGQFFGAGTRRIGSVRKLPLRPSNADLVYRPKRGQSNAWVHDVAVGRQRRPTIVYAVFPSRTNHLYRYARWNGRRWVNHSITHAGGSITRVPRESYYSGGITLDHRDPSIVFLSRQVGSVNEVERWQTPDGGTTWRHHAITSHSSVANVRPVVPRGGGDVVWLRGNYGSYRTFHTQVITQVAALSAAGPMTAFEATAAPGHALRFQRTVVKGSETAAAARWSFGDGSSALGTLQCIATMTWHLLPGS